MIIRLNKALRELNIGRQTAVGFLQKRAGMLGEVKDDLNFKLNDKQYAALVEAFKKDAAVKEKAEQLFKKPEKKKDRDNAKRRVENSLEPGAHQNYTPLGKIDLSSVGKSSMGRKSDAASKKSANKPETAAVSQKVDSAPAKAEPVADKATKPEEKPAEKPMEKSVEKPMEKSVGKPVVAPVKPEEKHVEKPAEAPKTAEAKAETSASPQPAAKAKEPQKQETSTEKPAPKQRQVIQKPAAIKVAEVTQPMADTKKGTEIFRTKTEARIDDTPKVTVLGKIDLNSINSSTRPKKKTRAERQRERQRQQNGGNNTNARTCASDENVS